MIHSISRAFIILGIIFLLDACSAKPVRQPSTQGTWKPSEGVTQNNPLPIYRDDGLEPRSPARPSLDVFPRPVDIEPQVAFWRKVYSKWGRSQVAIHDKVHMDIIYDVFELPGEAGEILTAGQKAYLQDRYYDWKSRLNTIEDKTAAGMALNADEKELVRYLADKTGRANSIQGASERLRYQRGLKERFMRGLEIGRRYDSQFRQIFRNAGLPEDLAYLPHVESSFQYNAHSSAGALGIWQFTSGAAKMFMNGDASAEARLDPINSTRGAARYLAYAFGKLGSWPLAVTSYNHGIGGMQRARNLYGHDFMRIVKQYDHPLFGFASRNYYAEFLAARDIASDPQRYFAEGPGDDNSIAWTSSAVGGDTQTLSPVPEPQEVPQALETVDTPSSESSVAASEPEPVAIEPTEAAPAEAQPIALAEDIQTQPTQAEPISQVETVQAQAITAEPIEQEASAEAEPGTEETVESTSVSEAGPRTPMRSEFVTLATRVPGKIDKAALAVKPEKAIFTKTPADPKKHAQASGPAAAKQPAPATTLTSTPKTALAKAPGGIAKSAKGIVPATPKQAAKSHPIQQLGKADAANAKPIHPAAAKLTQGGRQQPAGEGEKKPGDKIHIAKR